MNANLTKVRIPAGREPLSHHSSDQQCLALGTVVEVERDVDGDAARGNLVKLNDGVR